MDARISSPTSEGTAVLSPTGTGAAKYQKLETSATATTPTDDEDDDDDEDGGFSDGGDCEEGGAKSGGRTSGDNYQLSTTSDQNGDDREVGEVEAGEEEGKERGILGYNGLLAIPNVKLVLFLACAVQVKTQIGTGMILRIKIIKETARNIVRM